jgi:MFS family permease
MPPSTPLLHLIVISLMGHIALAGARITTSLYALSQHASEFTVGILIALFSVLPMLFAVSTGRLIDRTGILKPMLAGCGAIALGCTMPGIIDGVPILFLAAVLIGTGFMVIQLAAQHTVGAISTLENRAANFSWLALGFSISGFCGPVIAGLLIDHAHYRVSFIALGCFAIASLFLARFGRLIQIVTHPRVAEKRNGSAFNLLRDSEMRRLFLVATLLSSAWDLFTFVLPIHGMHSGLSASRIGFILGCFSFATFIVRLAMPWLSRRLSQWDVLASALLVAAICYALFPLAQTPFALTMVATALGLAVGSAQPNTLALMHQYAPRARAAEAVGLRITIGNACQVILPLAFGGAGAALGLSAVFWGMGAMIAAGIPLAHRKISAKK